MGTKRMYFYYFGTCGSGVSASVNSSKSLKCSGPLLLVIYPEFSSWLGFFLLEFFFEFDMVILHSSREFPRT